MEIFEALLEVFEGLLSYIEHLEGRPRIEDLEKLLSSIADIEGPLLTI